jgi:hypothetical protein
MARTATMQTSFGIECMDEPYYNPYRAHISEIHSPMLQIHGQAFLSAPEVHKKREQEFSCSLRENFF